MNVVAVAVKDVRDVRRSRLLWGATVLLTAFFALFLASDSGTGELPAILALQNLLNATAYVLPLIAIFVGTLAIAGERESGSIKYLLGLPNSRGTVLLGTLLGRAVVALVAVGVALLVGAAVLLLAYSTIPVRDFLAFSAMTLSLALVYVAVAVGVSAACATRGRATAGTVGIYFLLNVLWRVPPIDPRVGVAYLTETVLGMAPRPNLYEFAFHLSPSFAYRQATTEFLGVHVIDVSAGETAGNVPAYLTGEFMLVVLAAWIVVPLGIGYLRFRNAEIG